MTEHTKYALSSLRIAHRVTSLWDGGVVSPEPADEEISVKPTLNAGTSHKKVLPAK